VDESQRNTPLFIFRFYYAVKGFSERGSLQRVAENYTGREFVHLLLLSSDTRSDHVYTIKLICPQCSTPEFALSWSLDRNPPLGLCAFFLLDNI
jgi:hypothetical protein